jgi:AbrB family looped-hinge helix DNA binding protein
VGALSAVVRVNEKGRIVIPKDIREKLGIKEKQLLKISVVEDKIVLELIKDIADRYYGVFEVKKWPRDLDNFMIEVLQEWWKRST